MAFHRTATIPRGQSRLAPVLPRPIGSWSKGSPPYLHGVDERKFVNLRESWVKRMMQLSLLAPSHRVVAYFLAHHCNWATMDCWVSHQTLGTLAGSCEKTIQRAIHRMEDAGVLSVWRVHDSRHPLRYAPAYLLGVAEDGQQSTGNSDTSVHESYLPIQNTSCPLSTDEGRWARAEQPLSFKPAERGRLELAVANLLGSWVLLSRLANIDDGVVTRVCEAHAREILVGRPLKAARLAAKAARGT